MLGSGARLHEQRLVAADVAAAGENNRLQQIARRADAADFREVRAERAAVARDGVARRAERLRAAENLRAPLRVAVFDEREEFFHAGELPLERGRIGPRRRGDERERGRHRGLGQREHGADGAGDVTFAAGGCADFVERIGRTVKSEAVFGLQREQRGDVRFVPDAPDGLAGRAACVGIRAGEQREKLRTRRTVAPQARTVGGKRLHARIALAERGADARAVLLADELPHSIEARRWICLRRERRGFPHAINRAEHLGLHVLRGRATQLIPAARVRDEHAAVGILEHIGRVKIRLVAHEEIAVRRAERRAILRERVARDAAHIKLRAEQIPAHPERLAAQYLQPARRRRAEVRHDRHQLASARVSIEDAVLFAPHAAIDRVQDAVALAAAGIHKKSPAQKPLARRRKDDVHGVVHAARHHHFAPAAIGPRAEKMRGTGDEIAPVGQPVRLLGKCAFAPINKTIRPRIRPVQIVRATGQRFAIEPHLALVRDAIAIGVRELPDDRRRGDVK